MLEARARTLGGACKPSALEQVSELVERRPPECSLPGKGVDSVRVRRPSAGLVVTPIAIELSRRPKLEDALRWQTSSGGDVRLEGR